LISELLEASLPSRVVAVNMTRQDEQTWKAVLHDIRLREEADFYLSVRSNLPAWQVAEKFAEMAMAGTPDDVGQISGVAMEGIGLSAACLRHCRCAWKISTSCWIWRARAHDMLEQGVCLFYVPSLLGELELELFAVLRS
jgi:type VI secretion system protein ImpJ